MHAYFLPDFTILLLMTGKFYVLVCYLSTVIGLGIMRLLSKLAAEVG